MYGKMKDHLSKTLAEIKEAGLYKEERLIESAQQAADRKSTRLNSSHTQKSRMPSSA